jgi:hypothetical protein
LLTVQRSLHLGLLNDGPSWSKYLKFEVGVAGDGHELDITWLPQDDVVGPREVNYLKHERLSVVVAHVSESDWQGDPLEWDRLFARDHSVEWVWAALELVTGKPQPLKGVEVHEVESATPIHEGLSEPDRPDQRIHNEGKLPRHRDAIQVVHSVKSDQGLRPAQVL